MRKMHSKKAAHEIGELTELGYGSRSYLYLEIASGRLRAVKRGRRTIVLAEDLDAWLRSLPPANIKRDQREQARSQEPSPKEAA
jgi:hypothetical protein